LASAATSATHTLTAATSVDLLPAAALGSRDIMRLAVTEACLPTLGVVARFGAVARIEGIGLRFRLVLRLAEIALLPIESGLFAGLAIGTFAEIRLLAARTFAKIAAIARALAVAGACGTAKGAAGSSGGRRA